MSPQAPRRQAPVTLIHGGKLRVGKRGNEKNAKTFHTDKYALRPKARGIPRMRKYFKTTDND